MSATLGTRTELLEELVARYPQIPPEAVLKEDLLRTGMAFDDNALTDNLDGGVKPKSYFIFSFDQKPLTELGAAATQRPPEEIALTGGPWGLRRTIVSVRVNPDSPYRVARAEDGLRLSLDGREVAEVSLPPMPEYYRHALANGKTVMETAPTIEWGYLIYLTVLRLCQYFGAKEECGFCDINHNWRQHKKAGRPYTGVKPIEDVLEALALIDRYDEGTSHAYTLTGGSVTSTVEGLAEADFYGRYAAGDRGALPRPLDRQGRGAGAAEGRRAALQGLRHLDLPPELRGLGQAALLADLARQAALRRPRGVAPADPRRGRRLRAHAT